ncbi:alpha/beta-hydrolase [Gymnopilus junonius]|uniref:Alpha/beta-hydrolase n=1 Tax=Gymnopilus junonius TaxID=109634 RepID=A0A9P5NB53_GYMJU|nr:alpha/beta-hydrolase [Gymnopilus junonius]
MSNNAWPGLPSGITSRIIAVGDLDMHILEALPPTLTSSSKPPLLVLLHGFPELAYSWRKLMLPLSLNGYAVVAPDLRGFGLTKDRTRQSKGKIVFEEDLAPYRMLNIATDVVGLVYALGYTSVEAVIGHDFGSSIAAHCALIRPDLFGSVVLMSAPFTGPPQLNNFGGIDSKTFLRQLDEGLRTLNPPRKHYMVHLSTPSADEELRHPPQGLSTFLRTFYHVKSADWKANNAAGPLGSSFSPSVLAVMPYYYIMPRDQTMAECLASEAPSAEEVARNTWLTEEELRVYVSQYEEAGFQGGLNLYRCASESTRWSKDLNVFVGKQIEIPAMFIAGAQDWGVFQSPGAAELMRTKACSHMKEEDFILINGAGHWVQQEQPKEVVKYLLVFLKRL